MRSYITIILLVFPSFALSRFIKGPNPENFIEWYPALKSKSQVSSEIAWFYLKQNNNLPPLNKPTDQFLSFAENDEEPNILNQTLFQLFTKKNKYIFQTLILDDLDSLKNSYWDPLKPTRIIIHGFQADSKEDYILQIKDRILDLKEANNVITLDWSYLSSFFYPTALYWTDKVGQICASLIDFLCKQGAKPNDFHLIGHSLGAHVAGFAAKKITAGKIGRVTGLDPAYPGFKVDDKEGRLDSNDADFVDCIHTCGGFVAFEDPICDADFYPNGGISPQPGCSGFFHSTTCSHSRAHQIFSESIIEGHVFPANTCTALPVEEPVQCVEKGARMGFRAENRFKGIFYSVTNNAFPFATVLTEKES
ncbi:pancreatic triacylglycerol lipase-like [Rhodnius prolixus]|uniref:pancreatic triacylglycerol lipase-like n=1 Tax=Rhodnius prolixus TaxID=13249 RepID=UPI003D188BA1